MNYLNSIIIFFIFATYQAEGSCIFIEKFDNFVYKFKCDDSEVIFSCKADKTVSMCENKINVGLKKYKTKFKDGVVSNLSSIDFSNLNQVSCTQSSKTNLICNKNSNCERPIEIDLVFDELSETVDDSCKEEVTTNEKKCKKEVNQLESFVFKNSVSEITNSSCKNLEPSEKKLLQNGLTNILNPNFYIKIISQCFKNAKDEEGKLIVLRDSSELDKLTNSLKKNMMSFVGNELSDCSNRKEPLFEKQKLNIDRFVCLQLQNIEFINSIKCRPIAGRSTFEAFTPKQMSGMSASRDAAKNNDEKFEGKPIMIDSPPEISKPIPVKQTLAQIDKMVQDNGGAVSPEIAEKAGKLFNDSVYEPTRSAINYIDNKIFKADEASTAKYKSSNVASSGKRYQIGGNRNPASKPTANKSNRSASVSSATAAGVMGQGVGTATTGSSNVIKTALGEEKETPSPGKAAKVDNQATEKALPLNNESQRSVGSGQQANNNLVANSASGSSRNALDNENLSLSPKASAEVNQLVGQIKTVESAEDLKSLLGLEENQEALRHLVKPVASGQDRSPASTADPLINKLKEYNIKLYDERTGKTIYSPEKTEYIMRLSDKGVRLLKPIGGTKK